MAKKRNLAIRILRRVLIVLLVILLLFTLTVIIVPQYNIWAQEHEREQVAISWLEDMRLNKKPSTPVEKPTEPPETRPTESVPPVTTEPSVDTRPPETMPTDPVEDPTEPSVNVTEPTKPTEPDIPDVNPGNIAYGELYAAMQAYNEEIYRTGQSKLNDAFSYEVPVFDLSDWGIEDDIFGVISIPKIDVVLPVYLGATYRHMADGFAQMSQTSVPIGGVNTNCTLACHRGWNGMAYLRDVEMIELGDSVYVHNLWGDLEYRVVDIYVIEPNQTECLQIQEGRDLLTIFTCHPYRVSTHRYVLVCERYIPETPVVQPGNQSGNQQQPGNTGNAGQVQNPDSGSEQTPVVPDIGLDIKHDIIDEVTRIDFAYISSVIKGLSTTVTNTTNGVTVESSQSMIFWTVYFPWMLLILITVCVVVYSVFEILRFVKRQRSKKLNKVFKVKNRQP